MIRISMARVGPGLDQDLLQQSAVAYNLRSRSGDPIVVQDNRVSPPRRLGTIVRAWVADDVLYGEIRED